MEMRARLTSGALWVGSAALLGNSIGFVSTIILARLLVPADFGLVAIATAIMQLTTALTEMSLAKALVQHDNPSEDHYHTAWTMSVIRSVFLGAGIALLAWPVSNLYADARLYEILLVVACSIAINGLVNPKLATFERALIFRQIFVLSMLAKLSSFIVSIAVAVIYQNYWALVVGMLVSNVVHTGSSYFIVRYRPKFSLSKFNELFSFSVWLTLGNAVQSINWKADPLLLGYFFPTSLLGQYTMGRRVTNLTVQQLAQPIQTTLFPAFSRVAKDGTHLGKVYLRAQRVLCFGIFPTAVGLALLAEPLVTLVLGAKWISSTIVIQVLALTTAIRASVNINPLALATANTRMLFFMSVRVLAIRWSCISLGMYLGQSSMHGMMLGALGGISVAATASAAINMMLVKKIALVSMGDQIRVIAKPAGSAAAMAAGIYSLPLFMSQLSFDLHIVTSLMMQVGFGAMIYILAVGAVWIITGRNDGAETEIISIIRDRISKMR